jgi:hypothetical protein
MKRFVTLGVVAVLALTMACSQARALVITFDDLVGSGPVPGGYAGLNWNNFHYLDGVHYSASGYQNGVVSPDNVAYNAWANPASMSISSSASFSLDSAYLTAAWNDGLIVDVVGKLNGSSVYNSSFTINTSGPMFADFGGVLVDDVTFTSYGGTAHGYNGEGAHFAMDNLTIDSIPEPAFYQLGALLVLGGLGTLRLPKRV